MVREAYELNCPVTTAAGAAGEQSLFAVETRRQGDKETRGQGADAPNVVIETVKLAEDGSGDVVVRMYECKRTATRCVLSTTLPVVGAAQTDMLENVQAPLSREGGRIALDFRPFEVKTLRLTCAP